VSQRLNRDPPHDTAVLTLAAVGAERASARLAELEREALARYKKGVSLSLAVYLVIFNALSRKEQIISVKFF